MTRSLLVAVLVVGGYASSAAAATLRAGAAVVDITPEKLPVSMIGSLTDRQATSVHDPLKVRALVLDDGTTRLALVTVDTCLLSRATCDEAKRRAAEKTGIPAANMLMSATHTHSGAAAFDLGIAKVDPTYVEFLARQMAAAVEQAAAKLQPAEVGYGTAPLASEVHNRRWKMKPGSIAPRPAWVLDPDAPPDQVQTNPGVANANAVEPAGPVDPDVMVLAVRTRAGKPLALYAVYSLHYVGGIPRDALSADYFGEFAKQVSERFTDEDGAFTAMLANGTSGDINNVDVRHKKPAAKPFEQVRYVAGRTADVAVEVYRKLEFRDDVKLQAAERDLKLRRRSDVEQLALMKKVHDDLASRIPELRDAAKYFPKAKEEIDERYRQDVIRLAKNPGEVALKLQVLQIGELAIASIPCEPFAEVGLEIKRRSKRKPTFVVGLANGYNGYLPTPEQHRLGGYETWLSLWSYLEVDASTKISDTLVEMLNKN